MPRLRRLGTLWLLGCRFGCRFGCLIGCLIGVAPGCGPSVSTDGDGDDTGGDDTGGDDTGSVEPGVQPTALGAMYSACVDVRECVPLSFCVFPPGEGGYCSNACAAPGDPSECAPAPGDGAEVSCLDIREPQGREVCALDCSDGACPEGMRCEGIDTAGGERRICF